MSKFKSHPRNKYLSFFPLEGENSSEMKYLKQNCIRVVENLTKGGRIES